MCDLAEQLSQVGKVLAVAVGARVAGAVVSQTKAHARAPWHLAEPPAALQRLRAHEGDARGARGCDVLARAELARRAGAAVEHDKDWRRRGLRGVE